MPAPLAASSALSASFHGFAISWLEAAEDPLEAAAELALVEAALALAEAADALALAALAEALAALALEALADAAELELLDEQPASTISEPAKMAAAVRPTHFFIVEFIVIFPFLSFYPYA